MSNQGRPPTSIDQADSTNLFRAITHHHASLRRMQSDVATAFSNIVEMYVKEHADDSPFIYIYDPKTQPLFEKNLSVLEIQLSGVYSVVTDLSKELYPLKEDILSKPNIVATKDNQNITYGQNTQNESLGSKLKNTLFGKSEKINKIKDPWETTQDIVGKTLNIPNIIEMIVSTHARQYNKAQKFRGNLRAQQRICNVEFNYFRGTAKPQLNKLIGGRIEVVLRTEKPIVASVLSEVYRTAERNKIANMMQSKNDAG